MSLLGPISPRAAEPNIRIRSGLATATTRRTISSRTFGSGPRVAASAPIFPEDTRESGASWPDAWSGWNPLSLPHLAQSASRGSDLLLAPDFLGQSQVSVVALRHVRVGRGPGCRG